MEMFEVKVHGVHDYSSLQVELWRCGEDSMAMRSAKEMMLQDMTWKGSELDRTIISGQVQQGGSQDITSSWQGIGIDKGDSALTRLAAHRESHLSHDQAPVWLFDVLAA